MGIFNRITSFFKSIFNPAPKSKLEDVQPESGDSDETVEQSEIYLQSIKSVVDDIKISYPNAGQWFENLINEQVDKYGSKAVAEGLESVSPHELESLVQIAFYAPEHPDGHSAMIKLWSMITSEIPTTDDLKDMEDIIYQ